MTIGLYNRGFNDYGYAQNLNSNPMSGSRGGGFHSTQIKFNILFINKKIRPYNQTVIDHN